MSHRSQYEPSTSAVKIAVIRTIFIVAEEVHRQQREDLRAENSIPGKPGSCQD